MAFSFGMKVNICIYKIIVANIHLTIYMKCGII